MKQLLEIINGEGGVLATLDDKGLSNTQKAAQVADLMKLYDGVISSTTYKGERLLTGGDFSGTNDKDLNPLKKTYRLGGDDGTNPYTVTVSIVSLASNDVGGIGDYDADDGHLDIKAPAATVFTNDEDGDKEVEDYRAKVVEALNTISTAYGNIGLNQQTVATNQKLLDSRLLNVTSAEGRISNTDIAYESSRMARAELLAQNSMSSILYTRRYASFAVSSLFGYDRPSLGQCFRKRKWGIAKRGTC
jgi:flagellin-like hook-associated protein FlgL